ncbi:MAG: hypothetical protein MJ082_03305 [Clostridia bacterium]|nr:hypothetical protein [Clostridia bacterium]
MDDLERYGDYNGTEDDEERSSGFGFGKLLLIVAGVLIFAVLFLIIARVILFDHYPKDIRRMLPTDGNVAAYEAKGKDLEVYTQKLRFPYDDCDLDTLNSNDLGTFFADALTIIPEIGEVQIAVRLNTAAYEKISEALGIETLTDETLSKLTFTLQDNEGNVYAEIGRTTDSLLLYRYFRVAFGGIPFSGIGDGESFPLWLRLVIGYEGCANPYSYMLIYENNNAFGTVTPYKISKGELT